MHLPDPVVRLFERQYGVAARPQLLEHLSAGSVDGYVHRGAFHRMARGVYRVRGSAASQPSKAMAAVLRVGQGAVLAGPFVLGLFRLGDFSTDHWFEVLTPPGRRPRTVGFRHRPQPRPGPRQVRMERLPVVTVTDALLSSARAADELGARQLRAAFDQARWRRLTSEAEIVSRAQQLGRRDPGAAFFLDHFTDGSLRPESEPERRLGELLGRFDPAPTPQVWVLPHRRVDFYWRAFRLGAEYHGAVDHAFAEARLRDDDRIGELREAQVQIVPVVKDDLLDADRFLAWINALLLARAVTFSMEPPRMAR